MKVGQVAELLGVTTQTVRNWTAQGLLKASRSKPSGYRAYLLAEVKRAAKTLGITIKEESQPSQNFYVKKLPDAGVVYVVDFFCGCGGVSAGLLAIRQSHLKFELLGGFDIDEKSLETYRENTKAPGICQDIRELADQPSKIAQLLPGFDPDKCRPLLFVGCAPCQGFSAHRKKDTRDDARNSLMSDFAKIAEHYLPDFIFMENVPEIITGKYSDYFDLAREILTGAGYTLDVGVCDLSQYGVPQRRRRAVVLGGLNSRPSIPTPILTTQQAKTVREAISHLEPISAGETCVHDPLHRCPAHTARIIRRIMSTPPDGGDRRQIPKNEQLECHRTVDDGDTPGFTDVYGRLRWDTPSVTITAKSSTPSCGRFLHPEQHRNISIREAAILQGFPQSFKFVGPLVHIYRQIGEAVPPLFASHIGWAILNAYRPVSPAVVTCLRSVDSVGKDVPAGNGHNEQSIGFVDAFCGCGGLSLGLKAASIDHLFSFDLDKNAVASFKASLGGRCELWDITDHKLPRLINSLVGNNHWILTGGPPCQGFSQQRRGHDIDCRNNLVLSYAALLRSLDKLPSAIVLENVTYLDSPRGRDIYEQYQRDLTALDYISFRHDLNSAEFGVPQLRRRIVTVSIQRQYSKFYLGPQPICDNRWPILGESLYGMPDADGAGNHLKNHEASREGHLNIRRIAYVDMGKGRLSIPSHLQLTCHQKYGGHLDVYGRLDWFSQARTITGGFDSFTRGEFGHPIKNRSITAREAARIQGFPDWFVFLGNRQAVRRQIGNAVPPPLGLAIGKAIRSALLQHAKGINDGQ